MRVLKTFPPNFRMIAAAFPVRHSRAIFCYGGTIHNPAGVEITNALMAHERVHMEQQGDSPEQWWTRYVMSPEFRLEQELPAHVAELRSTLTATYSNAASDRAVDAIAHKLSAPLYGRLVTFDEARDLLMETV